MSDLIASTQTSQVAERLMNICNACRYCEGFCPVFPAMTRHRTFSPGDLDYLANLCHNCTACYHACQYKPPHEFDVNLPPALTALRHESYLRYAWPGGMARAFQSNGTVLAIATALICALVMGAVFAWTDPVAMRAADAGPGAFYRIVPHAVMVTVAGGTLAFSIFALLMGARRYLHGTGVTWRQMTDPAALRQALSAAATLQHLGGAGDGCNGPDDRFSNRRRWFHQATMWGFMLCFAATCVATVYELMLGWPSPFGYTSLPVLLGTAGGAGLVVGPLGLMWEKYRSDPQPVWRAALGMDYAFTLLLLIISLSGFALLVWRGTSAMGTLLALHLGFVLAFFVTLPYSKSVHAVYRFAALVRYYAERGT